MVPNVPTLTRKQLSGVMEELAALLDVGNMGREKEIPDLAVTNSPYPFLSYLVCQLQVCRKTEKLKKCSRVRYVPRSSPLLSLLPCLLRFLLLACNTNHFCFPQCLNVKYCSGEHQRADRKNRRSIWRERVW